MIFSCFVACWNEIAVFLASPDRPKTKSAVSKRKTILPGGSSVRIRCLPPSSFFHRPAEDLYVRLPICMRAELSTCGAFPSQYLSVCEVNIRNLEQPLWKCLRRAWRSRLFKIKWPACEGTAIALRKVASTPVFCDLTSDLS